MSYEKIPRKQSNPEDDSFKKENKGKLMKENKMKRYQKYHCNRRDTFPGEFGTSKRSVFRKLQNRILLEVPGNRENNEKITCDRETKDTNKSWESKRKKETYKN